MMNRLELKQVVKQYADKTAVNGVTLNVKEGRFTDCSEPMVQVKQQQCAWCSD